MSNTHFESSPDLEGHVLHALRQLVEHHSSARAVAERMGQAHNYVARLLRGETKLRLDVLQRVLEALGVADTYLLELLQADRQRFDGEQILGFYGGDGLDPEGDFFDRHGAILGQICEPSAPPDTGSCTARWLSPASQVEAASPRRQQIEALAKQRFADPQGALKALESTIAEMLSIDGELAANGLATNGLATNGQAAGGLATNGLATEVIAGEGPGIDEGSEDDAPRALDLAFAADLSFALVTLGTAYRVAGRRSESSQALRWAFRTAERSGSLEAVAAAYQRAAYLLRDLGFPQAALLFLSRASDAYLRSGDLQSCAQVFVDRAVMWVSLGNHRQAVADYEAGLRLLPEEQWRYRVSALAGLAHCHEHLGDFPKALSHTRMAEDLYGDARDQTLAFLVWNRANFAWKTGHAQEAEPAYHLAMELLDRWSEPQDVALCALDLADFYLRHGERAKLMTLAEEILAWLPALRSHRLADGVMMEIVRCVKWGEVTPQLIRESKAKIESKGRKGRSRD